MRMRMLVAIVGLLAVPALAVAEGSYGGSSDENKQMGSSSDVSPGSEQRTGMETGTSGQMDQSSQQQIFRSRDNFDLKGTVASVDATENKITVNRPNLPPAELTTSDQTKVKLNGKQASLTDLQPGSEIRAKFNLAQDQALAVEVDAKSSKSGSMQRGSPGSQSGSSGSMQHDSGSSGSTQQNR